MATTRKTRKSPKKLGSLSPKTLSDRGAKGVKGGSDVLIIPKPLSLKRG